MTDEFGHDAPFWPKVGQHSDVKFRPIGAGHFGARLTADEFAFFACRLAAEGLWFDFVPETWDDFTQSEINTIARSYGYWLALPRDDEDGVEFVGDLIVA